MRNTAIQPTAPATPRRREIDHVTLRQMFDLLVRAREGETIAQLLDDLYEALTIHFAGEESSGGFFDTLLARHAAQVAQLREEHRVFLEEIARLRGEVTPELEPVPSKIVRQVVDLVAALRDHEALEEHLLVDSIGSDFGGEN
jgi:hypothetical protein